MLASWRPREAYGIIPVQKAVKTQEEPMFQFKSEDKKESWQPSLKAIREKINIFYSGEAQPIFIVQAFIWLDKAHPY